MLLRYPGGKRKTYDVIPERFAAFFKDRLNFEYREPFFGAGAIGFKLLDLGVVQGVWFNDRDPAISAIWNAAVWNAEELKGRIRGFTPTVDAFYDFKERLLATEAGDSIARVEVAFMKIAIHAMSFSGLGTKAGGPIGGKSQTGKYKIDCRYNPDRICKNIDKVVNLFGNRFDPLETSDLPCTCLDFEDLITAAGDAVLYLDPPYYEKGPGLYQFSFTENDHVRLAKVLATTESPWLMTYDEHEDIIEFYEGWTDIDFIDLTYTINSKKDHKKRELIITSKNFTS